MYASRSLCKMESKYAQIEREALAIIFAIKKFHQYMYGEANILAVECCTLPVTAHDIAEATRQDKMLATVLQSVLHGRWNMSRYNLDPFYRRRENLVAMLVVCCGDRESLFQPSYSLSITG